MGFGDHGRFIELFNKKFSFIEAKARRAGGERLIGLIETEHHAGRDLFDVTVGSRFAPSFIRSGVFTKYVSPEYQHFSEGTKDPEGYWADVKEVKFIPEDLGVYDRQRELHKEFDKVLQVR